MGLPPIVLDFDKVKNFLTVHMYLSLLPLHGFGYAIGHFVDALNRLNEGLFLLSLQRNMPLALGMFQSRTLFISEPS